MKISTILAIVAGTAVIGVGGYAIYRKYSAKGRIVKPEAIQAVESTDTQETVVADSNEATSEEPPVNARECGDVSWSELAMHFRSMVKSIRTGRWTNDEFVQVMLVDHPDRAIEIAIRFNDQEHAQWRYWSIIKRNGKLYSVQDGNVLDDQEAIINCLAVANSPSLRRVSKR